MGLEFLDVFVAGGVLLRSLCMKLAIFDIMTCKSNLALHSENAEVTCYFP